MLCSMRISFSLSYRKQDLVTISITFFTVYKYIITFALNVALLSVCVKLL
jgi:hypothetical protein